MVVTITLPPGYNGSRRLQVDLSGAGRFDTTADFYSSDPPTKTFSFPGRPQAGVYQVSVRFDEVSAADSQTALRLNAPTVLVQGSIDAARVTKGMVARGTYAMATPQ